VNAANRAATTETKQGTTMTDLKGFIAEAAGSLGISSDQAGNATAGLLGFIQDQADGNDASAFLKALPGAEDLMNGGKTAEAKSGGLMGGLMGAASGLLGGKAGSALGVLSLFKSAGLDSGQAGGFVSLFFDFVGKNVDGALVSRILDQVPEIKGLLGR
jgi:hypothetical protein